MPGSDALRLGLMENGLTHLSSPTGWMLTRVKIGEGQRRGSVFVPMHWNSQFAGQARMGSLVASVVDPLSGQPESKHTPVNVEAWQPAWQAVLFSTDMSGTHRGWPQGKPEAGRPGMAGIREEARLDDLPYWVKVPGEDYTRHEFAGLRAPDDWQAWLAHTVGADLGPRLIATDRGPRSAPTGRGRSSDLAPSRASSLLQAGDAHGLNYHALLWVDGQPVAALYVATDYPAIDREAVAAAFREAPTDSAGRLALLAGRAPAGGEDVGRIVCSCFRIGEHAIHKAIDAGCTTLVLTVLGDARDIPAGVPSRAPQHQLGLRHLGGRPARWLRSAQWLDALQATARLPGLAQLSMPGSVEALGAGLKCGTHCGSCIPELKAMILSHQRGAAA